MAAHLEDDGSCGAPSPTTVVSGEGAGGGGAGGFALRHGKTDEVFRGRDVGVGAQAEGERIFPRERMPSDFLASPIPQTTIVL